jgi:Kef-type K+ transport system membrane component KefB
VCAEESSASWLLFSSFKALKILSWFIFSFLKNKFTVVHVTLGIILGPTALGRIPGFTKNIFPQMSAKTADDPDVTIKSFDTFYVAANIGLIFFMFLMGLEFDGQEVKKLARFSFPVASM